MKYIDSGNRKPSDALGTWFREVAADQTIHEVRAQSGFFTLGGVGLIADVLTRVRTQGGLVRFVVGSNSGSTRSDDLRALFEIVGTDEVGRIGVVSFGNAYFHPKTIHVTRRDGSAAAYVGSANLTSSGVNSLHVEAGIILDTADGDPPDEIARVAHAVDRWFTTANPGFRPVRTAADIDRMVRDRIVDSARTGTLAEFEEPDIERADPAGRARLSPLISMPSLGGEVPRQPEVDAPAKRSSETVAKKSPLPQAGKRKDPRRPAAQWSKQLSRSDAQRKRQGNQRGSITLVAAGHPINAQTYFREHLFGNLRWHREATNTGESRESTVVPFATRVLGKKCGTVNLRVTYAVNRESAQANYTSLLHLGALADEFSATDLTGYEITLTRWSDGSFELVIA